MSFIEKSVARLEQLERLEVLAVELGRSHYPYNAPPKYYSVRHTHWQCMLSKVTVCISIDIDIDHFLFWCDLFPVCRSRIHLCCPTHSQREMDPWAWGGVEGTQFNLFRRPLWFNTWVSIMRNTSEINSCPRGPLAFCSARVFHIQWHMSRWKWSPVEERGDWHENEPEMTILGMAWLCHIMATTRSFTC